MVTLKKSKTLLGRHGNVKHVAIVATLCNVWHYDIGLPSCSCADKYNKINMLSHNGWVIFMFYLITCVGVVMVDKYGLWCDHRWSHRAFSISRGLWKSKENAIFCFIEMVSVFWLVVYTVHMSNTNTTNSLSLNIVCLLH